MLFISYTPYELAYAPLIVPPLLTSCHANRAQRWRMTERAKENLYADYCQDPEKWTLKALADKYGISPRRVPVIIQHMKIREEEDALAKKEAEKGAGEVKTVC